MTKDVNKDKSLLIKSLNDIDNYLRSTDDQRWNQVEKQIKGKVDDLYLEVLLYCITPRTRDEIFKYSAYLLRSSEFVV